MRGIHGWKRSVAWALAAVCAATAASFHRHESLADLVGEEYSARGESRAVTSHSPLSSESHVHRVVRFADGDCLACQSQRTAALVPAGVAALESVAATPAATRPAPATATRLVVASGPRAPPVLL
jgi:hypothetical protein